MFVHDFTFTDAPAFEVRQRLIAEPTKWLASAVNAANQVEDKLIVSLGAGIKSVSLKKRVEIEVSTPRTRGDVLVIPVSWSATGVKELFPKMQADLEIAPFGPDKTQLVFLGTYDAPLGPIGRKVDAALLHRIAEASVRTFLELIANALQQAHYAGLGINQTNIGGKAVKTMSTV